MEISLDHAEYRRRDLTPIKFEVRIALEIPRPTAHISGSASYSG